MRLSPYKHKSNPWPVFVIWFRQSADNVLKYGVKYLGVRRPRAYCPALILLPYLITNCSVQFRIDIFTHNDHDRYVHFSTNSTQKRISYQNGRLIFVNLRPPVVYSPYSPSYYSSNIPMYEIYSWKMVFYDRKYMPLFYTLEAH